MILGEFLGWLCLDILQSVGACGYECDRQESRQYTSTQYIPRHIFLTNALF